MLILCDLAIFRLARSDNAPGPAMDGTSTLSVRGRLPVSTSLGTRVVPNLNSSANSVFSRGVAS